MKRSRLLLSMCTALVFALSVAGCNGGGSNATGAVSTPDSGAPIVVPGTGNGSGPSNTGQTLVTLSWDASVTNTDGSALSDLAGYTVHYGTAPGSYSGKVNVGLLTTCSLSGLAPGTYFFTVTAYNKAGTESGYSNEASKSVTF